MAANSLADSSAGAVVFMLIVGLLLALWPIAIITNFRGYRDSHARRSTATGRRFNPGVKFFGEPDPDHERAFSRVMQYIVAGVFLVAAVAVVGAASAELVRRMTGG
ncbi:hypothetical protein [Micromonospora sp. NBC_00858]|uniref:hypothetical protein n=1 Tax=Micromonospora sp. NBC_00858 TaxID=2975979 RepID=UPI00386D3C02|nr:hypothetical protein OG990_24255 [Micromonospora sp. NBC_00858]